MHSKTSDNSHLPQSLWKAEPSCDEMAASSLARELAGKLKPGSWILLEGPMGAGKSTFARALLQGLGFHLPPEGSPTFAIAHEYEQKGSPSVIHLDLYRLENEQELDAAGIQAYFWERPEAVVIAEWTSNWPSLESALLADESHPLWRVELDFTAENPELRSIRILERTPH